MFDCATAWTIGKILHFIPAAPLASLQLFELTTRELLDEEWHVALRSVELIDQQPAVSLLETVSRKRNASVLSEEEQLKKAMGKAFGTLASLHGHATSSSARAGSSSARGPRAGPLPRADPLPHADPPPSGPVDVGREHAGYVIAPCEPDSDDVDSEVDDIEGLEVIAEGRLQRTPPAASSGSAASSSAGPMAAAPPPPLAPAPPARARQRREEQFGPWTIAPIVSHEVQVGWGATCKGHVNHGDAVACKKQLIYGSVVPLPDAECKRRVKAWLLAGVGIPFDNPDGNARGLHLAVAPRDLPLVSDAEMQRLADEFGQGL